MVNPNVNAMQDALRAAKIRREAAEADLVQLVAAARLAGLSWSQISYPLDVSKQAAQQRFS